jgi:hypothetical protein
MLNVDKMMLELAKKIYPANMYEASDARKLRWLAEDALKAARRLEDAEKS